MGTGTQPIAAIVVYNGVSADEADVFRFVLSRIPGLTTVAAGVAVGQVAGAGGVETAEVSLRSVSEPEIVAVPGGLGCHRQVEIGRWLGAVSPRWIVTSSTGSALLATAGLLRGSSASTHWLAGGILERHGAHPATAPVVVNGPIVTSSGLSGAFRAALVVAQAYGGPALVRSIRADSAAVHEGGEPPPRASVWSRLWAALTSQRAVLDDHEARLPDFDEGPLDLGLISRDQ